MAGLRNRRRSFITVGIAAVGTAGVLIGGGFALFTYESLRELAARESGHLVIAHKDFFDRDGEFSVKGPTMKVLAGSLLESGPSSSPAPGILLGSELARLMKAQPGSGLTLLSTTTSGSLNATDVIVKGVVTMGVPEVDKRLVFTDIATAQKLLLTDKVSTLSVYLHETQETDAVRDAVAGLFPQRALQTWRDEAIS